MPQFACDSRAWAGVCVEPLHVGLNCGGGPSTEDAPSAVVRLLSHLADHVVKNGSPDHLKIEFPKATPGDDNGYAEFEAEHKVVADNVSTLSFPPHIA